MRWRPRASSSSAAARSASSPRAPACGPGPLGEPRAASAAWRSRPARPIVPVAITGTEDIRRGWRIRPRRVTIRCGRAMTFPRPLDGDAPRGARPRGRATACGRASRLQWEWLGGHAPGPPRRGRRRRQLGDRGRDAARARRRAVQLACRTAEQAARAARRCAPTSRYLPGVELPEGVSPSRPREVDSRDVDARVPCGPRQAAAGGARARSRTGCPEQLGVLVLSKGLVGARRHAAERASCRAALGTRPVACLGGPGPRAGGGPARARPGCRDPGPDASRRCSRAHSAGAASRARPAADLVGVELAGRREERRRAGGRRRAAGRARTPPARPPGASTPSATRSRAPAARSARDLRRPGRRRRPGRDRARRHTAATAARASCSRGASAPTRSRSGSGRCPRRSTLVPALARAMESAGVPRARHA